MVTSVCICFYFAPTRAACKEERAGERSERRFGFVRCGAMRCGACPHVVATSTNEHCYSKQFSIFALLLVKPHVYVYVRFCCRRVCGSARLSSSKSKQTRPHPRAEEGKKADRRAPHTAPTTKPKLLCLVGKMFMLLVSIHIIRTEHAAKSRPVLKSEKEERRNSFTTTPRPRPGVSPRRAIHRHRHRPPCL